MVLDRKTNLSPGITKKATQTFLVNYAAKDRKDVFFFVVSAKTVVFFYQNHLFSRKKWFSGPKLSFLPGKALVFRPKGLINNPVLIIQTFTIIGYEL